MSGEKEGHGKLLDNRTDSRHFASCTFRITKGFPPPIMIYLVCLLYEIHPHLPKLGHMSRTEIESKTIRMIGVWECNSVGRVNAECPRFAHTHTHTHKLGVVAHTSTPYTQWEIEAELRSSRASLAT